MSEAGEATSAAGTGAHRLDNPVYARWTRMRCDSGVDSEWEDFRAFERWCLGHGVVPGDRLRRVDGSRPWGPGNVRVPAR